MINVDGLLRSSAKSNEGFQFVVLQLQKLWISWLSVVLPFIINKFYLFLDIAWYSTRVVTDWKRRTKDSFVWGWVLNSISTNLHNYFRTSVRIITFVTVWVKVDDIYIQMKNKDQSYTKVTFMTGRLFILLLHHSTYRKVRMEVQVQISAQSQLPWWFPMISLESFLENPGIILYLKIHYSNLYILSNLLFTYNTVRFLMLAKV